MELFSIRIQRTFQLVSTAEACRKGATDGRPERSPVSLGNQGADRKSTAGRRAEKSGMHPSYSGTDGEGAAYGRPEESGYLPADQAA